MVVGGDGDPCLNVFGPPPCQLYILWWPPDVSNGGGGPQANTFEQVSSDGHHMSLAGAMYSEVQCIMGNGNMVTPPVDRQTRL